MKNLSLWTRLHPTQKPSVPLSMMMRIRTQPSEILSNQKSDDRDHLYRKGRLRHWLQYHHRRHHQGRDLALSIAMDLWVHHPVQHPQLHRLVTITDMPTLQDVLLALSNGHFARLADQHHRLRNQATQILSVPSTLHHVL